MTEAPAGRTSPSAVPPRNSPDHDAWLAAEASRLIDFAVPAADPDGGFGWLDDSGAIEPGGPRPTWITCRMTYCFALAAIEGRPGAAELVDHGVTALRGALHDDAHGGWYAEWPGQTAAGDAPGSKDAYPHMFVLLAASAATVAGRPGAPELLAEALDVVRGRFFQDGLCVESWDETFTTLDPYRGANANMHAVEAFLAAADATGDDWWRQSALSIADKLINTQARAHDWRLPEHYSSDWEPQPDYNHDRPADAFRPYGATIGHGLEWSRLLLHLEAALAEPPAWLRECSVALFDRAVADGWNADGAPGFVYTTDWDGTPVVRERMHWVLAEALGAAITLHAATGDERYVELYDSWWSYAAQYLLDERGSWNHELDEQNRPAGTVWKGKPDVYHALQAVLLPNLPLAPTFARAMEQGAPGRRLIGGGAQQG